MNLYFYFTDTRYLTKKPISIFFTKLLSGKSITSSKYVALLVFYRGALGAEYDPDDICDDEPLK